MLGDSGFWETPQVSQAAELHDMENFMGLIEAAREAHDEENEANDDDQQEAEDQLRLEEESRFRDVSFVPSSDLLSALNLSQTVDLMTVRHIQLEIKTVVERDGLAIPVKKNKRFQFWLNLQWSKLVGRAGKCCLHKAIIWLEENGKITRPAEDDD